MHIKQYTGLVLHICCSVAQSCPTLCDPMDCSMPGLPVLHYLRVCSKSCPLIQWFHPATLFSITLFSCPQSFPHQGLFHELAFCIRRPKYWHFSLNISPSNEYPGLISFKIDWFDLLAIQGILKSLLQHHSLKASILQCSVFFMAQL